MVPLILITVMAISLVVSTGYTAYTIVQSSERVSQAQRNAAQMHRIAALVEANLRTLGNDGVLSPPAPKEATEDAPKKADELPEWLMPGARTPWGALYGYCVFAPAADRVTPSVATAPWPAAGVAGARAYTRSAPAAPADLGKAGVLAVVLAPAIGSDKMPDCGGLTLKDGQITVPNGSAVAVTRGASADLAALAASATVQRHVAPVQVGDGSGTTPSDAMTLTAALGFWQATRPATTVLRLAPGRHEVPAAVLDALAADPAPGGRAMRLVLKGEGPGVVVAANPAGAALRLPTDARIENVALEIPVEALPGTQLTLAGDNSVTTPAGPALRVAHARLDVQGALRLASGNGDGIQVAGGQAVFHDADLAVTVGAGRSALVSMLGAGVTFSGERRRGRLAVHGTGMPMAAIRAGGGHAIIDHTDVSVGGGTQFGVILENGALELTGAAVGSPAGRPAAAGVLDLGGSHAVADPASQVWVAPGGRCAHGELFARPATPKGGTAAGGTTANRANWTCRN